MAQQLQASRDRYLLLVGAKPVGPFDGTAIRARIAQGMATGKTLACPVGGKAWVPLAQVPALWSPPSAGANTGRLAPPVAPQPSATPVSTTPAIRTDGPAAPAAPPLRRAESTPSNPPGDNSAWGCGSALAVACAIVLYNLGGCGDVTPTNKLDFGPACPLPTSATPPSATVSAEQREAKDAADAKQVADGPVVAMTPTQFNLEYNDNPIAADRKYKGKVVEITGKIIYIRGGGYVELGIDGVPCHFKSESDLASLHRGQQVTVRGICKGERAELYCCQLRP